ncbi:CRISPR-associated endonuclease Cas2 [Gallibacterium melopsittaci]|uniref:CRISPR-associated endoribonuclease Cas2 n=1 Tax=Gallibacterium melopsittaci TaxID=516063 RepID=A0ABV6HV74_9PAST
MQYLIGYDISDEKRLQRIYKKMVKYATPIQYSIFLFEGTQNELNACINQILEIFNQKEDDLRVYPLPKYGKKWQFGKSVLPEGIIWTVLPQSFSNPIN